MMADGFENIGIFRQLQRRRRIARLLLDLLFRRAHHPPVGDGGDHDGDIRRQSRYYRIAHLLGTLDMDRRDLGRIGDGDRAGNKRDLCPQLSQSRRNGMALLARGAVGDVAHRVNRFMRGAGGHDGRSALQGLWPLIQQCGNGFDDLQRLGHAAKTRLALLRHLAGHRTDKKHTVFFQRFDITQRGLCRPHLRVHRRCRQHLSIRREKDCGGKIVCQTIRHLRHQIGGGGCDQHEIAVARQPDMADILFILPGKKLGEDMRGGQRADSKRGDEFLRALRHDRRHLRAALFQATDEIEALIGRDAAGDNKENMLA